jgi:hypothetical protein
MPTAKLIAVGSNEYLYYPVRRGSVISRNY